MDPYYQQNMPSFISSLEKHIDEIKKTEDYGYDSLALAILDAVFSLRAKYKCALDVVDKFSSTENSVERSKRLTPIDNLLKYDGNGQNLANFVGNKQKITGVLKADICINLAKELESYGIKDKESFNKYNEQALMTIIKNVKGIGDAGARYLFMLLGDENKCKPDVHIRKCMNDVFGATPLDVDCQCIMEEAVKTLRKDPNICNLTVKRLDHFIWTLYSNGGHI